MTWNKSPLIKVKINIVQNVGDCWYCTQHWRGQQGMCRFRIPVSEGHHDCKFQGKFQSEVRAYECLSYEAKKQGQYLGDKGWRDKIGKRRLQKHKYRTKSRREESGKLCKNTKIRSV